MEIHTQQVRQDVAQPRLEHTYVMPAGDKKSWYASPRNKLTPRVRKIIAWMADLDCKKTDVPFKSLTTLERGKIHCTAHRLMKERSAILHCAQGGELSDPFSEAGHILDGLAA